MSFYVHVADVNASGNIPDDLAQMAASLADQANTLEKQGQTDKAQRMRQQVEECRHWRAVEMTINTAEVAVVGISSLSLEEAPKGASIWMMGSVDGKVAEGVVPSSVNLIHDGFLLAAVRPSFCRQLPNVQGAGKTFLQFIGVVTGTHPLRLDINGASVQVDNPLNKQLYQREKLSIDALHPGERVRVRASLTNETQIGKFSRVVVLPKGTESESPLNAAEQIGF